MMRLEACLCPHCAIARDIAYAQAENGRAAVTQSVQEQYERGKRAALDSLPCKSAQQLRQEERNHEAAAIVKMYVDEAEAAKLDHDVAKGQSASVGGANPKDLVGATKSPLSVVPWGAVVQAAPVFAVGAKKYGPFNWRDYPVQEMTYVSAALRHLLAWVDGQDNDDGPGGSGLPHLAHAIAGLMILVDAKAVGSSFDDRPKPGATAAILATQTGAGVIRAGDTVSGLSGGPRVVLASELGGGSPGAVYSLGGDAQGERSRVQRSWPD